MWRLSRFSFIVQVAILLCLLEKSAWYVSDTSEKNTKYILKGKKGKCQEFELTSVNVKLTIEWYISKKNTTNVIFLVLLQKLNLK